MIHLLFLIVIVTGLPAPAPLQLFERQFRQACAGLELISTAEHFEARWAWGQLLPYKSFREQIRYAQSTYRELRGAPLLECAGTLPDFETCEKVREFCSYRLQAMEKQQLLFGCYRWEDDAEAVDEAKSKLGYWTQAATAANPNESYRCRRLALAWLRDH